MMTGSSKLFSLTVHLEQEEVEASDSNGISYYKGQAVECPWKDSALPYFGPDSQSVCHCGQRYLANMKILKCITKYLHLSEDIFF